MSSKKLQIDSRINSVRQFCDKALRSPYSARLLDLLNRPKRWADINLEELPDHVRTSVSIITLSPVNSILAEASFRHWSQHSGKGRWVVLVFRGKTAPLMSLWQNSVVEATKILEPGVEGLMVEEGGASAIVMDHESGVSILDS